MTTASHSTPLTPAELDAIEALHKAAAMDGDALAGLHSAAPRLIAAARENARLRGDVVQCAASAMAGWSHAERIARAAQAFRTQPFSKTCSIELGRAMVEAEIAKAQHWPANAVKETRTA